MIISVAPFFTAILSHLFLKQDEKLRANFFIGFIVAMLGIGLISFNGVLFYSHKEDQQLWLQYDFDNPASVLLWHPVYDTGVVSV